MSAIEELIDYWCDVCDGKPVSEERHNRMIDEGLVRIEIPSPGTSTGQCIALTEKAGELLDF